MNILIFMLVAISLLSITTLTSYALFTNETEGNNSINLTVSTAGRVTIKIFAQDTGTEVGTLDSHQNIIKFNVKDGFVMESFSCTTGEATYNKATNVLTITNATKNGTCNINYVEGYNTLYDIIINQPLVADNGLSVTTDTNTRKPSYYYKGNVENNYVVLENSNEPDKLWRIVRINEEDNSIRLIKEEDIGEHYYNQNNYSSINDLYYSESNVEGGIMKTLNNWYESNLKIYENKIIVEGAFCEQFKVKYSELVTTGNITPTVALEYNPSLKCKEDGNGKGPLTLKIGLLSVDEVMFSGLDILQNAHSNYLCKNKEFYTMTPAGIFIEGAHIWRFNYIIYISSSDKFNNYIRPVINVKKNVLIKSGNGTKEKPYFISNE